jgi:hypothetical protein
VKPVEYAGQVSCIDVPLADGVISTQAFTVVSLPICFHFASFTTNADVVTPPLLAGVKLAHPVRSDAYCEFVELSPVFVPLVLPITASCTSVTRFLFVELASHAVLV